MTGDATPRVSIPRVSIPRVSIVVPSFNNASFIEATMDSILGQTAPDQRCSAAVAPRSQ